MNEVVSNKERKKERKELFNPKGPHRGEDIPTRNIGIPIPQTDEWHTVMVNLKKLAAQEDSSLAHVCRAALFEYQERHMPGNPVPTILNYVPGGPDFSEAAKEKLATQTLPDDMVWEICENCHGEGCKDCHGTGKQAHRWEAYANGNVSWVDDDTRPKGT